VTPNIRTSAPQDRYRGFSDAVLRRLRLSGEHSLEQNAAALDKNQLAVQAVLFVEPNITRKPQRCELAAGRRVRDNDIFQRARRGRR